MGSSLSLFFSSLSSFAADFFPGFLLVGAASSGCLSSCPEELLPSRLELLLPSRREVLLLGVVVVELELFCRLSEVFRVTGDSVRLAGSAK